MARIVTGTLLAAILLALPACRSRGHANDETKPKRDYLSVNRSSIAFLKETAREGRRLRKANLHESLRFKPRIQRSLAEERTGRRFAWESFKKGSWDETENAWRSLKGEMRWDRKRIGESARFGFLDSGD